MKKTHLIYIAGSFILLVLVIFLIFLKYLARIESNIFALISFYGYAAIFIVAFIVDILLQPLGPELPLIASRAIELNIIFVALLTIIASTLASLFNYKVGKTFYPMVFKKKKGQKYLKIYKKYGKYALLLSALGPIPYVPFCWFTGAFGSPIKHIVYFGILPRTLRIIFISYLLFLFL